MMSPSWKILGYALALFSCLACVTPQKPYNYDYPTANLSTSWINAFNGSILETRPSDFDDASAVRPILLRLMAREDDWSQYSSPAFACGFYCTGTCHSYLFGVYIVHIYDENGPAFRGIPQVVWSANRNNPVRGNATVNLTAGGDLVLKDADGASVWSTNTAGKAVAGLNLTQEGNLVLYDANHSVIWQSFDHPTDCLLVGQRLPSGKNLTAAASPTSWSAGIYSVAMTSTGLVASMLSHPPLVYYKTSYSQVGLIGEDSYAEYKKGSLELYANSVRSNYSDQTVSTHSSTVQYIKLESDGHLRVFEWGSFWTEVADLLKGDYGGCIYPMSCGKYGICSKGQCSCPESSFRQISVRHPDLGCAEVTPLTCSASGEYSFLDLKNVTYSSFVVPDFNITADISNTDVDSCKQACLKNCSCKAAFFVYSYNAFSGLCYLPTDIFSFMDTENGLSDFIISVFIKVQNATSPISELPTGANGKGSMLGPILGSVLGFSLAAALIGTALFVYLRRKRGTEDAEEDHLELIRGMPTNNHSVP